MRSSLPRIALRMWAWAAALRILKRIVPLETLVHLMHRKPLASRAGSGIHEAIESYMNMTGRFPFRPPSNCLERSLAAYRMLCEAATEPELVIGLRHAAPDLKVGPAATDLRGHVWVTVAGRPLGERTDSLPAYTPVVRFDANGQRHPSPGSGALPSRMAFD